MSREYVIAGNWKMNNNPKQAGELATQIVEKVKGASCGVVLGVPYVDLDIVLEKTKKTNVAVAAQNCHWENSGAFTGEISPTMLSDMGVQYVIIGHSERRQYFGETDQTVSKRVRAALDAGLKVIVCVGETLEQRELGITSEVVSLQTKIGLSKVNHSEMKNVIIAYEPVWAIGTGKTATSAQANEVCAIIRGVVGFQFGQKVANSTVIQYGGSMNQDNAKELLAQPDVDGGLIGGASLKAADFASIVSFAK